MSSLMGRPVTAAAILTGASVAASVIVTTLVLMAFGVESYTPGLLLAGLLPAAMAPGPTYMLMRSNTRRSRLATRHSISSPTAWPWVSLMRLK
jgi:hypothetical protein